MRHYPGEVYVLPPEADEEGDPKPRRHVLMCACEDEDPAALAYASTSSLEASFGATHLVLDPFRTSYRGTGFNRVVTIYLSRLASVEGMELTNQTGKIIDEMPQLRELLERALGLGTGTCTGGGRAAGSLRGRLLELTPAVAAESGTAHAIAVCEPTYSLQQRYVHVIPVYGLGFKAQSDDLVIERAAWLTTIGAPPSAILAFQYIFSVFYPRQVSRPLAGVVDEVTMIAIDDALSRHFGL